MTKFSLVTLFAVIAVMAINLAVYGAVAWTVLSFGTSTLKAVNKDCGTTYSLERVVPIAGSLMCEGKDK